MNEQRGIPPGATVVGTLGAVGVVLGLAIPWSTTPDGGEPYRALDFGVLSGVYLGGAVLLIGLAVAAALTRGLATEILGVGALLSTALPVASLVLVERVLSAAHLRALENAGTEDSISMNHQGHLLAALPLFFLVLAAARFAWTARPTVCYAAAAGVAGSVMLVTPWGYRQVVFEDRAELPNVWFAEFGALGVVDAVAVLVMIGFAVATALLAGRAWWPAVPAVAAAAAAVVLTGFVDARGPVTTDVAGAEETDYATNTGITLIWGLLAVVMCVCALVTTARRCRAARRQLAQTTPAHAPYGHPWHPQQSYPPGYPPQGYPPPGYPPQGYPPPGSGPWR